MKARAWISTVIAVVFLFAGCAGGQGTSAVASEGSGLGVASMSGLAAWKTDDALLLAMEKSLAGANGETVRVDYNDTWSGGVWVRITPDLLDAVVAQLTGIPSELADVNSTNAEQTITVQGGDGPGCSVQLFRLEGRSMLWLQVGEEYAQYYYPPEVFDTIDALVRANTVEKVVRLEGEHIPLQVQTTFSTVGGIHAVAMLEFDDVVVVQFDALAKTGARTGSIEVFDIATGESLHVQQYLMEILRMEKYNWEGSDYRLMMADGTVYYRNLADHANELPVVSGASGGLADRVPAFADTYDVRPEYGLSAFVDEEGLWLLPDGGAQRKLLGNDAITNEVLGFDYSGSGQDPQFAALFTEPRILNGGKTVVATITLPSSQTGFGGIAVVDAQSGGVQWLASKDFEGALPGNVQVVDDTTLAVRAIGVDTLVDLVTMKTRTVEYQRDKHGIDYGAYTADYESFLYHDQGRSPDGEDFGVNFTQSPEDPLLVVRGGYGWPSCVGESLALLVYDVWEGGQSSSKAVLFRYA